MIVYSLSPFPDIHIAFATSLLLRVLIMTDILFKISLVSCQITSRKVVLFCKTEVRTMRCQML